MFFWLKKKGDTGSLVRPNQMPPYHSAPLLTAYMGGRVIGWVSLQVKINSYLCKIRGEVWKGRDGGEGDLRCGRGMLMICGGSGTNCKLRIIFS